MLLKSIWHGEGLQLEDCVHWQNCLDKQGQSESPRNITATCMCVFVRTRASEREAEQENVFVCDSERCPGILWDRWLEEALFPFPKGNNLSLAMYLNSIFNTNVLKGNEQTCIRWLCMVHVNSQPQQSESTSFNLQTSAKTDWTAATSEHSQTLTVQKHFSKEHQDVWKAEKTETFKNLPESGLGQFRSLDSKDVQLI